MSLIVLDGKGARKQAPRCVARLATALPLLALGACASTSLTQSGALSSYDGMQETRSTRAKALYVADPALLASARTLRLEPVAVADRAATDISAEHKALVANAIGRILCNRLDDRFELVAPPAPADLAVKVTVTKIAATDSGASAASIALSIASPVPFTPRVPFGLGSFAAEGEALTPENRQAAALVWTQGADVFTTNPTVSSVGDAYQLSGGFAKDMARLLTTGRDPFARRRSKPEPEEETPKREPSPLCAAYGDGPGVAGFVGKRLGLPPEWTDRKPQAADPDADSQ